MQNLDWDDLRYFLAVTRSGSLSGAATMGEDATGTHRSAPATPAPGFEHDADKAKKK